MSYETSKRLSEFHWSGAESSSSFLPSSFNPLQNPQRSFTDMEIRDDYKFLRIEDAFKALHLHVNLIGVIVELDFPTGSGIVTFFNSICTIPKSSISELRFNSSDCSNCVADCSCTLKIVDPWHSGSGLPVKFVARTIRTLPRVESVGDIILLSRVKVDTPFSCRYWLTIFFWD